MQAQKKEQRPGLLRKLCSDSQSKPAILTATDFLMECKPQRIRDSRGKKKKHALTYLPHDAYENIPKQDWEEADKRAPNHTQHSFIVFVLKLKYAHKNRTSPISCCEKLVFPSNGLKTIKLSKYRCNLVNVQHHFHHICCILLCDPIYMYRRI